MSGPPGESLDLPGWRLVRPGWKARAEAHLFQDKWSLESSAYTERQILVSSPLHIRGTKIDWSAPVIGIGGTRSPTVAVFNAATELARALSGRRSIVCSGGVPGIDLAAHLGALDCPAGQTLCVLANPVDGGLSGHEWKNVIVEREVLARGAFVSEYTQAVVPGSSEFRDRLLQRDRIITALCDIFVMFECSATSATIDTARRATIQGKPVFAHAQGTPVRQGTRIAIETGLAIQLPDAAKIDDVANHLVELAIQTRSLGQMSRAASENGDQYQSL